MANLHLPVRRSDATQHMVRLVGTLKKHQGSTMKVHWPKLFHSSFYRLFFRYYLGALLSLALIISLAGIAIDHLYSSADEDYGRDFMRGTVLLIRNELLLHPEQDWPAILKKMEPSFSYHLALTRLSQLTLVTDLDEGERQEIRLGHLHLDMDGLMIYLRLGESQQVLTVGPLGFNPGNGDSLLTDGIHAKAGWWMLTALGFGILVWLVIRVLWRDLVAMRRTAGRWASGDLSARAPDTRSRLLRPLFCRLNTMAEHLQNQMTSHYAHQHAVAYQLRAPLARLRTRLGAVEKEGGTTPAMHQYWLQMEQDVQELDELLNTSMRYAQLDQGRIEIQKEATALHPWFTELIDTLTPLAPEIAIQLSCNLDEAEFDPALMHIAVRNVLINAQHRAQAQICISIRQQDKDLEISIEDDGPALAPSQRQHGFEPSPHMIAGNAQGEDRYGMQLSFAWLITEHHGGRASIEEGENGATRFVLRIPGQ
jgi:signal transduction histidine kinase